MAAVVNASAGQSSVSSFIRGTLGNIVATIRTSHAASIAPPIRPAPAMNNTSRITASTICDAIRRSPGGWRARPHGGAAARASGRRRSRRRWQQQRDGGEDQPERLTIPPTRPSSCRHRSGPAAIGRGKRSPSVCCIRMRSAVACAIVTPGFIRPTPLRKRASRTRSNAGGV